MEQQTVSVAKAGIIATLNARTSVLASANPVGSRYNPRLSIVDNIHLPPSLISRFDLIYLVLDKAEEANDRRLARHLLSLHYPDAAAAAQVRRRPGPCTHCIAQTQQASRTSGAVNEQCAVASVQASQRHVTCWI